MARIKREDHARILHLIDVERRAVREIAAEYGCTPANIYNLLTKLRGGASTAVGGEHETQQPLALEELPEPEPAGSVIAAPEPAPATKTAEPRADRTVISFERAAATPMRQEATFPEPATLGARLSKPGMGLIMRTADGEETMTPFRSVDDLLSAIKPILRASARSPEPVWFSLQPVDSLDHRCGRGLMVVGRFCPSSQGGSPDRHRSDIAGAPRPWRVS